MNQKREKYESIKKIIEHIVFLRFETKSGYIMQEVQMVPDTIIDNIKYVNKKITKEEITEIFKKLKLHEKIMSLPKGYQTNIYENPDVFSTGEKQIISFARIMAMSPDVVILDEVTSTLSWENEELIKNAMERVLKRKNYFYDCPSIIYD